MADDIAGDEEKLKKDASGLLIASNWAVAAIPLAVAYFADTKWVIASGFAIALLSLYVIDLRLRAIATRVRRMTYMIHGQAPVDD